MRLSIGNGRLYCAADTPAEAEAIALISQQAADDYLHTVTSSMSATGGRLEVFIGEWETINPRIVRYNEEQTRHVLARLASVQSEQHHKLDMPGVEPPVGIAPVEDTNVS